MDSILKSRLWINFGLSLSTLICNTYLYKYCNTYLYKYHLVAGYDCGYIAHKQKMRNCLLISENKVTHRNMT